MNSSLSFHSQEQWHCWLPNPRAATATHARKRFRPAGHTDATAQHKRAVAAEGEVLQLRGKVQEAEQRAQEVEWRATAAQQRATAAERDRDHLRAQARKPKPKPVTQGHQQVERTEGEGTGAGVGAGTRYSMAWSRAWKAKATKAKGELSAVAATARLLLSQRDGPTFESVVLGFQGALDSHDDVERRYPGDAPVEAATNPAFEPPPPPQPPQPPATHGFGTSTGTASP